MYIVYNEFKSVIQQRVVVEKLLPLGRARSEQCRRTRGVDYIFEQPPQEIFNRLLPRYVEIQIYRALLESAASEHGARMAAMDTAIAKCRRNDRIADSQHEPRAPGGDHAGNYRSR